MSKFSVIEGSSVTAEDILQACMLDQMVYEEEYYVTLQQCLEWHKKNDRIYTMIRDNTTKDIIAYVNMSPVTKEYYDKIKSGQFIDTYLPPDAIVDYFLPDTYYLYFSSIVVHPDYQNSTVFLILFNAITQKFLELGKEQILIEKIVADAVSEKGQKFCELFGMQKQKDSHHNSQIYEVQMMPPQFRISSKATRELFAFYENMAAELGLNKSTNDQRKFRSETVHVLNKANEIPSSVFISYCSEDKDTANQICGFLEKNGVYCWLAPRNIDPGANYATQIVKAIKNCDIFILIASDKVNSSNHVSNEVSIAFDNKKVIIPFKIEELVFSDEYLYFLGRKHWVEAYRNMDGGMENLLITIKNILQNKPPLVRQPHIEDITEPEPILDMVLAGEERTISKYADDCFVTNEEICKCILQKMDKYKSSNFKKFVLDFGYYKNYVNEIIKRCFYVIRYNKYTQPDNYIDYMVSELIDNEENTIIRVSGLPGVGKGLLMQAAFYDILMKFKSGETNYLPFYISQGYYEKLSFDESNHYEEVKKLLRTEFDEIFSVLKMNREIKLILFVDEVREHRIGKVPLENLLLEVIDGKDISKRVISIDNGFTKSRNKIKRVFPIISDRVNISFDSHMVDSHDEAETKAFIQDIINFKGYDIIPDIIFDLVKKLKLHEIDIHIIKALAEEILENGTEIDSIGDLYETWALREFKGSERKLHKAAKNTFDYLFDESFDMEGIAFNDPQWRLIHRHQTYVDLLISYYMIKEVEAYDNRKNCDFMKIMLTASTDKLVGSFLEKNYALQEKVLEIVTCNYHKFDVVQKSSAIFWLAKIRYPNLVSKGVEFLTELYNEIKPFVKSCNEASQKNYNNQFLFRSICFCMSVYGQSAVLDDYLCLLITNDAANAINRGAIIEYYSDQYQMAAKGAFYLDTDIKRGASAIKALLWKINKAMRPQKNNFLEMDLVTISTLFQKRMQSIESSTIPEIRSWIAEFVVILKKFKMRPQKTHSEIINYYFDSINEDFTQFLNEEKGIDICQNVYNNLRKLRDTKRKQWVEKLIEDPESISEHTYSTWMMAMLFLPNELRFEQYSKKEILDMLLIHDMAEATLGDQLIDLNEPTRKLREHNEIMKKLFVKGSYSNVANLTYYYDLWNDYYNGGSINARIARDVNLIQTVYTFCEYFVKYPNCFDEEDRTHWMKEKGNLETEVGYDIFEKLVENNIDFFGFFDKTIKAGKDRIDNCSDITETDKHDQNHESHKSAEQMEAYTVVSYNDLLSSRLDISKVKNEIVAITESLFVKNQYVSAEDNLKLLENISENWRVILNSKNELVGYWVFVALQENVFEEVMIGTFDEKDITLETIEFIDFPGDYKGYLLMSGTKPEARTASLVQKLYESLALHIQSLAQKGIFFDEIAALAESPMGISAMKKLGMKSVIDHIDGGEIFACELKQIDDNKYFSSFEELRDLYTYHFNGK